MALPWTKITGQKNFRAARNSSYGGPLVKAYPPGVFYASNTYGAPGQPSQAQQPRILPTGQNQATDPRATRGQGYFGFNTGRTQTSKVTGGNSGAPSNTVLIGGSSYSTAASNGSSYILWGVVAVVAYLIFFR